MNRILHVWRAQDKLGHHVLLTELHDGLEGVPMVGVGDNEDDAHGDVDAVVVFPATCFILFYKSFLHYKNIDNILSVMYQILFNWFLP